MKLNKFFLWLTKQLPQSQYQLHQSLMVYTQWQSNFIFCNIILCNNFDYQEIFSGRGKKTSRRWEERSYLILSSLSMEPKSKISPTFVKLDSKCLVHLLKYDIVSSLFKVNQFIPFLVCICVIFYKIKNWYHFIHLRDHTVGIWNQCHQINQLLAGKIGKKSFEKVAIFKT